MTAASPARRAIRRNLLIGLTMVGVMALGAGGWAATTQLAGAIVAPGTLVVNSYVKKVQHPTGGIVANIRVQNGDVVAPGDVLIRLDDTQTRASLAVVRKRLDELEARAIRLETERDGLSDMDLTGILSRQGGLKLAAGERRLFEARRSFRNGQVAQLQERIAQFGEEIGGLEGQVVGKDREIELIRQELSGTQQLLVKGLIPVTRVNALEREAARLTSERGALVASIAQAKGRIAETQLQAIAVDQDLQQQVAQELREVQGTIGEFEERQVSAEDALKRIEIRAPQAGVVHELAVHTSDAVVGAGEQIMLIVPVADELEAEVRISPQDIDQIVPGQAVHLRFSAFNQRTTPDVSGAVRRIGADLTRDPQTGLAYYVVRVEVGATEIRHLGGLKLLPGMPVEAFVQTGERTALSYLVKPIEDQIERAFREQ